MRASASAVGLCSIDGLRELHAEYPRSRLDGIEWSWPLRLACQWRCRCARVTRGDIWRADWSAYQMVYVFQRPESMARALAKGAPLMLLDEPLVNLDYKLREELRDELTALFAPEHVQQHRLQRGTPSH